MTAEERIKVPISAKLAYVRAHPAPRYAAVGILSTLLDFGLLRLLHGQLHVALLSATGFSFAVATLLNFGLNRQWVFGSARESAVSRQILRFVLLVVMNLVSTLIVVGVLTSAGFYYLLAKLVAITGNAIFNFFALRFWVFRAPAGSRPNHRAPGGPPVG